MRRLPAEEILGEWGIRDVTPPSLREREQIAADRDLNPLAGTPLRRRLRNFRPEPDNQLAALGGPLPYMRRLRTIEQEEAEQLERLAEAPHPLSKRPERLAANSPRAGTSERSTS